MSGSGSFHREIRSFVRRAGRMTSSQEKAIADLWPVYGIEYADALLEPQRLFGRKADLVLEIGFGNGDTLVSAAAAHPDQDFIGVEVHEPGIGHCLIRARQAGVDNLRIIAHDAVEVIANQIPDRALARVNLLFPDPWPKKRHHKRRIVQPPFLELLARKLRPGGCLYIATDWAGYAEHIDEVVGACEHFALDERREHGGDRPLDRDTTKFERRGLGRGHRILDWRLVRR